HHHPQPGWDGDAHQLQRLEGVDHDEATQQRRGHVVGVTATDRRLGLDAWAHQLGLSQRRTHQQVDGEGRCRCACGRATEPGADGHPLLELELHPDVDAGLLQRVARSDGSSVLVGVTGQPTVITAHVDQMDPGFFGDAGRDGVTRGGHRHPQDVEARAHVADGGRRKRRHRPRPLAVCGLKKSLCATHRIPRSAALLRLSPDPPMAVTSMPAPGPLTTNGRVAYRSDSKTIMLSVPLSMPSGESLATATGFTVIWLRSTVAT